jgi:fluoride ion exporter CrcB/FEX
MLESLKRVKKLLVVTAIVGVMATLTTVSSFAAEGDTTTAVGALPTGVNTLFSTLATGLVATIGAIAVIALTVYAAPMAIKFAKKIFNKIAA